MIATRSIAIRRMLIAPWLGSVALGAGAGGLVSAGHWLGLWAPLAAGASETARTLTQVVGPVWVPMLLVALRVGWLALRALRTRLGRGGAAVPARPELGHLAPLFAALGLCGTVWGLSAAFNALEGGGFLERLPALLGGLGAAMTSTLVGLGLQIGTLLLAAFNPSWSHARVSRRGDELEFTLDGRFLGEGAEGQNALIEVLGARQPEALKLAFASHVSPAERARVREILWARTDSAIPMREVLG